MLMCLGSDDSLEDAVSHHLQVNIMQCRDAFPGHSQRSVSSSDAW